MPGHSMNIKSINKNISNTSGKKVFVGLSGGVDSAVSAALLRHAGYDVTGVFIKVWSPASAPCAWREERRDAMRVAARLKIPFLFLDLGAEYKKGVADYMIREYKTGRTPNPDVMCNREIKFGAFWREAEKRGAAYIATGHYARLEEVGSRQYVVREGKDKNKDQSYFLWTLTQEDLSHTLFPIGALEKREVRELAKKHNLQVAEKKDSQGICFIGDVSMEEFLSEFIESEPGEVVNAAGVTIGRHKGAPFYTIGERHGFQVTKNTPDDKPFYVIAKDLEANTITVSNDIKEILQFSPRRATLTGINWITRPQRSVSARIRYRGDKIPVRVLDGDIPLVEFPEPIRGLSLGQSLVFYDDDICLGGGIIDSALG